MLYDRDANVLVGPAGSEVALNVGKLRVVFDVEKTLTKKVNRATVDVFNLNEESRDVINLTGDILIIKAGYVDDGGAQTIFVGEVTKKNTIYQPPDVITRIESGDGTTALSSTRLSLSYKDTISVKQILRDAMDSFDLVERSAVVDSILNAATDVLFNNGYASSGPAKEVLDEASEALGLEWSIQDNQLHVVPKNGTDGTPVVKIASGSGMISSPERSLNIVKKDKQNNKDRPGWMVKSLLQPRIIPGGSVELESREIPAGTRFRVEAVRHRGDSYGDDWYTEVDVTDVD